MPITKATPARSCYRRGRASLQRFPGCVL